MTLYEKRRLRFLSGQWHTAPNRGGRAWRRIGKLTWIVCRPGALNRDYFAYTTTALYGHGQWVLRGQFDTQDAAKRALAALYASGDWTAPCP
jgi:hypothetical protein